MASVLVVDDEPDTRSLAELILKTDGHDVTQAPSADVALSAIETEPFDVVLLDVRMPGLDGWDLLARLRTSGVLEATKVVMTSAHAPPEMTTDALERGAHAFLPKPFTWDELRAAVARVLT